MKTILKLSLLITLIFTFNACSQKVQIKALKASKLSSNQVRYISIEDFKYDNISQSSQIYTALSNVRINDENYFHIANRKNINSILREQKLKDSGLVDLIDDEPIKGLQDVKTILTGRILQNDVSKKRYYALRTNYKKCIKTYSKNGKKYCSKYAKYKVVCQDNNYKLKTKIDLVKVSDGMSIFSNIYYKQKKHTHCSDDNHKLPSKNYVNTNLANSIANNIVLDIAPSYVYFTATLLDSLDTDVSSKQKANFKLALKMIDLKRITKANKMLLSLDNQLHHKSYVVMYDLAITYEALGELNKALSLLKDAQNIALYKNKVIEEIASSISRVSKNISEQSRTAKQL